MAFLQNMVVSTVRKEMKKRLDEVLNAGNEWNKTARELKEAIDRLASVIKENSVDAKTIAKVDKATKRMGVSSGRLSRAFEKYSKTMENLGHQLGVIN